MIDTFWHFYVVQRSTPFGCTDGVQALRLAKRAGVSAGPSDVAQHTLGAAMLWAVRAHLAAGGPARMSLVTFGVDAPDTATPAAAPFSYAAKGEHVFALPL